MAWTDRLLPRRAPTPEDAVRLRDALVVLLRHVAEEADAARRSRIERLLARLDRFPAPSGLPDRIARIVGGPAAAAAVPEEARAALVAVLRAMARTAIEEEEIARRIRQLRRMAVRDLDVAAARQLAERAGQLEEAAVPLRRRYERAREEMVGLVEEVGSFLAQAGRSSDRMGDRLGELARVVAESGDPEGLRRLRVQVGRLIVALQQENEQLKHALADSLERAARLERLVRRRTAELEQARAAGFVDALTGVYNRAWYERELPRVLAAARRARQPVSLLVLDIDEFKAINDTFGHAAGDDVLAQVAARIGGVLRGEDAVARTGGEEFVVLLYGADVEAAIAVAERIRARVEERPCPADGRDVPVTVSIGVAQARPGEAPVELFRRADAALYEAKRSGRNRCCRAA